jgi:hypothetical protein
MWSTVADVFDHIGVPPRRPGHRRKRRSSPQAFRARRLYGPDVRWVKGPLPFTLLGQAYRLHHAGVLVLLAIKREVDIQRWRCTDEADPEITVTSATCDQLGLGRDARLGAIRALEAAGLITVTWAERRAPKVRLAPGLFEEGKITVEAPRR